MAITTLCPGCNSLFRLPDTLAGKQVRCQKCEQRFTVPGVAAPATEPAPAPGATPAPVRDVPTEEFKAPPPPPPEPAAPPEVIPTVLLLGDPDPAPPPPDVAVEPGPAPRRRPREEDSDADDLPPLRKRPPVKASSPMAAVMLVGMAVILLGLVGIGAAVWVVSSLSRPRPAQVAFAPRPPMPAPQPPPFGGGPPVINPPIIGGPFGQQFGIIPPPQGPVDDAKAVKATLDKGMFRHRGQLKAGDPLDRAVRKPSASFLVELEAGRPYVIDHRKVLGAYDPIVRCETLDGTQIGWDDDGGENRGGRYLDSQLHIRPAQNGTFRVVVSSLPQDRGGQGDVGEYLVLIRDANVPEPRLPVPVADLKVPQPVDVNQPLRGQRGAEDGLEYVVIGDLAGGSLVGDLVWAPDHKAFFTLSANGVVRRVGLDGLVEQKKIELGQDAGAMALSAQGLVVTLPKLFETWVLDPATLAVKKRVYSWAPLAVAASPAQPFAFVSTEGHQSRQQVGRMTMSGQGLLAYDLSKDEPERLFTFPMRFPNASPDGRFLFTSDQRTVHRYRVTQGGLALEQTSNNLGNGLGIFVSGDGKFVSMPVAHAGPLPNHPAPQLGTVYVYAATNLRTPAVTLHAGNTPRAVGHDPKSGDFFVLTSEKPLVVFDKQGVKKGEHTLGSVGDEPRQCLAHPDGGRLLVRFASNRLAYVTRGSREEVAKAEPKKDVNPPQKKDPEPAPVPEAESVAAAPVKKGEFVYRELKLPNLGTIGVEPVWDADGAHFFYLEPKGTLHKVRAKDFVPVIQQNLGQSAGGMALSAEGLVLNFRATNEVWVLDPQSLAVRRRITCPASLFLAAEPALSVAAVVTAADVYLLDLKKGAIITQGVEGRPNNSPLRNPVLSPDGKYLFLGGLGATLVRARVEPHRLVHEETKTLPLKTTHQAAVSPDSKFVGFYATSALSKLANEPTPVYAVGGWKEPAFTLPVRARYLSFEPSGALYLQAPDNQTLRLERPADNDAPRTDLGWQDGRIRHLIPHPRTPGTFLVTTIGKAYHAERAK